MDLSELKPDVGRPAATTPTMGREAAGERCWRELVAQVGSEVEAPLAAALERVTAAAASGRLDRTGLRALRDEIDKARRIGMAAQQISRFGSGRVRQHLQRCDLAQALRHALAQRSRESDWLGIELRQDLKPAEVMIDASMLPALLQALLEWCLEHARSPLELELAVDVKAWPAHARLRCRFAQMPADAAATRAAIGLPRAGAALDSTAWRLIERLAQALSLMLQREERAGQVQLTLEFPRTVSDSLLMLAPHGPEPAPAAWANSQPMVGRHVLVVAARRETRNGVCTALRTMGLMLDFVASVDEARAFCEHGLPHAIVYEAALAGDHFQRLRASWSATAPQLTFVEIAEHGQAIEVSDTSHGRTTRIGRDVLVEALGQALVHELAAVA
jgi:hypothetical protein